MNKQTKTWLLVGVILVIIIALFLLINSFQNGERKIKVGAVLGLTGAGSFYSEDVNNGVTLAQEELKEEGVDIELIIEDGKTDAKESVTAFNKLINIDNVDVAISLFSVSSVPLAPIANESNTPLIVSITSAKDIGINDYVLQYYLRADDYAHPIASTVNKDGYKKVAVMHEQDDFGKSVSDSFEAKFSELAGEVLMTENYLITETDFSTQLNKIKNSDAQALVFAGFKPHYVKLMQEMRELNVDLPIYEVSPNTMYPSVVEDTGTATENIKAVSLDFPIGETGEDFKIKYEQKFGKQPNVASSLGYDMIQLIAESGIDSDMTGEQVMNKMINLKTFIGLNGEVEITSQGEVNFPTHVVEVKNGEIKKY